MFKWKFQFLKTKIPPHQDCNQNPNHHMTHKQGETFWFDSTDAYQLEWPLLSVSAWGEKDILDIQSFWHLRNKGRWHWLSSQKASDISDILKKTAIDSTRKVSFPGCIPPLGQDGRKETESFFSFTSFPITGQPLIANTFFVPPGYLPLHPVLVSEYIKI